ncbi:MAG: cytochrome-c oxidase, cbb3-type subunit I [Bacteroidota bacterium]|nr:cytochrome-c oxidase, cbb3-type subunit I [Bacteroidota bacterium]MDP4232429.1 cytochrome-c oxidase, cbb3-type subunit I [Bacteroidota bacterium]MDP4241565.1 cytochrome-c oxidase, cbb3-type subunit I [Bacteroidota bacterium]MDP4286309.1 cytochrome-c oxidase, cbb3-type subunit I [Bacteroidota bacterium]
MALELTQRPPDDVLLTKSEAPPVAAGGPLPRTETVAYDNNIVRLFSMATMGWGIIGMLVGIIVAMKLYIPDFLGGINILSYGRLRPLHTNAVIFAFAGNAIFVGVYYSLQRLCKARMASDLLSKLHFWGWQIIIVSAAITLPLGFTTSKEYAELEWPIDIAIAAVWVIFGWNMIWTILHRKDKHMYVAVWFYLATFLTVAILHIVNSLELPVSFLKSYSMYAGVQDALVQWWYGHNAVAFFLTTPFLGVMYYFVPKAADRPIFSYRLSIIHFWGLIFIYIWAGPHHLLYTALPDWAQSLGSVFSIMLIAPSWGGMINGLMTLRGAWDKVRTDPVLKFFVVGITAYGMATFEGPMMAFKNVNALTHYTNYVIGHVHLPALLWNGGFAFALLYYIFPRIYRTKLYSLKMANWHFWLMTLGVVFYVIPMYWAGITEALMFKQFRPDGSLMYPNFLETVMQIKPMYIMRSIGGALYISGAILAAWNLFKTAKTGSLLRDEEVQVVNRRLMVEPKRETWHRALEAAPLRFSLYALVAVLIGGLIEYVPTALVESNVPTIASVMPYTPLEVEGRDIYIREGCNNCHSQMIRPFRSEVARYGDYSKPGEFVYDHPFLWGSKRTGPDLARIGGKYPSAWHWRHMMDPRSTSPNSIMPAYTWLFEDDLDLSHTEGKIITLRNLGVPYAHDFEFDAVDLAHEQQRKIAAELGTTGLQGINPNKEIIALIAYLQRMGTDIKKMPVASALVPAPNNTASK